MNNPTICAIATAPGGAIGIIRISGSEALTIADRIFRPVGSNAPLADRKPTHSPSAISSTLKTKSLTKFSSPSFMLPTPILVRTQ